MRNCPENKSLDTPQYRSANLLICLYSQCRLIFAFSADRVPIVYPATRIPVTHLADDRQTNVTQEDNSLQTCARTNSTITRLQTPRVPSPNQSLPETRKRATKSVREARATGSQESHPSRARRHRSSPTVAQGTPRGKGEPACLDRAELPDRSDRPRSSGVPPSKRWKSRARGCCLDSSAAAVSRE